MTSANAARLATASAAERLRRRIARALRGLPGLSSGGAARVDPGTPAVDLIDRGDAFVVLADFPGFAREDLSVTVAGDRLTIEATSDGSIRRGEYLRQEREASTMRRTLSLPEPVEDDAVATDYRRGVAQVVVEKAVEEPEQRPEE